MSCLSLFVGCKQGRAQAAKHACDFLGSLVGFFEFWLREKALPLGNCCLSNQLHERAIRKLDETCKIWVGSAAASLGDVGCNGHRRSAHLAGQTESLVRWKRPSKRIHAVRQFDRL